MNKFDLFKGFSGSLLTFLLCFIFTASLFAEKKEVEKRGKQVILWFDIRDLITDAVVTDTITIDLMYPDSTLIYTKKLRIWNNRRTGAIENTTVFTGYGRDFLVRLSHPDYETVIKPVHVKEKAKYAQVPLRIRRLTKREKQKATMLDEVVVTSSVVEFVHKGGHHTVQRRRLRAGRGLHAQRTDKSTSRRRTARERPDLHQQPLRGQTVA